MADRGTLLRAAVLRDVDDDNARAVYADWLQERGDPRGELISLETRWAAGRCGAREVRRILRLRGALAADVKKRVGYPGMSLEVERGFVVTVDAQLSWLLERGAELLDEEPVRYVIVRGARASDIGRLSAIAAIERVSWLWLSAATPKLLAALSLTGVGLRLTPRLKELPALLDLPQAHLVRAFVPWSGYSVESLAAAAAAEPALSHVEWLALHEDRLVAPELLATLAWRLRHLDLSQRTLSREALAAMTQNDALAELVRLDLSGTDLDDQGATLLGRAPWALAQLDISKCNKLSEAARDTLRQRFGDAAVVTDSDMLSSTITA